MLKEISCYDIAHFLYLGNDMIFSFSYEELKVMLCMSIPSQLNLLGSEENPFFFRIQKINKQDWGLNLRPET